jgi:hypothetical protein
MIRLQSTSLRVEVQPEGGRVTSVVDLRSGREWIDVWGTSPAVGDMDYDQSRAGGWDECFPSIAASAAGLAPWGALRDHGEIWGRPPTHYTSGGLSCDMTWMVEPVRFRRSLSLADASIIADYRVENTGAQSVPWLWSQHALLKTQPGDVVCLKGHGPFLPAWTSDPEILASFPRALLKAGGASVPAAFDALRPSGAGWAAKLFAEARGEVIARLESNRGAIEFRWLNSSPAQYVGLWINNRGWPADGDLTHVAFEPTTCPCDGLEDAARQGLAPVLSPGQSLGWTIEIRLEADMPKGGRDV